MRRLIRPKTISGKIRLFALVLYLSSSTAILAQNKPSTAVARTLQTQSFPADVKTTLKASINALQDLDYTIDVLNSDVGLITASRTTEEKKAEVSSDEGVEAGPAPKPIKTKAEFDAEAAESEAKRQACINAIGIAFIAVFFVVLIGAIFGDDDDDDDDDDKKSSKSSSSSGWRRSDRSSNTEHRTVNNYYEDNTPDGPRIYRYKVTINIDESGIENTVVRVSASGELEQDGKILESGGIHEPEFFKRFFASMNKSLFLDENLPAN